MFPRLLKLIFPLALSALVACSAPSSDSLGHTTTFSDAPSPSAPRVDQNPPADPQSGTLPSTPQPRVQAYVVPTPLREKLIQKYPQFNVEPARGFTLPDPTLKIDQQASTMTFTGSLTIGGRSEAIELRCHFEAAQIPWSCDNMYPTDLNVARQHRLQATAKCVGAYMDSKDDKYKCKSLGVKLFVLVDGKTESQIFQSQPFEIRRASSGDSEDEPVKKAPLKSEPAPKGPKIDQKATPMDPNEAANSTAEFIPTPEEETEAPLTEDEAVPALEDANQALEISPLVPVPPPATGEYSIPGIEKLRPTINTSVPEQAIGAHSDGSLRDGAQLPMSGAGFICRQQDGRNWGTNLMIEMIEKVSASVAKSHANAAGPIVVANISQKRGGPMCSLAGNCHQSHQTGLDADVVLPSTKNVTDMWNPCRTTVVKKQIKLRNGKTRTSSSTVCSSSSSITGVDDARFWQMLQSFTCAKSQPVIAMFLDQEIKKHMCAYARSNGVDFKDPSSCGFRTLQALKHEGGHYNHVHIRLRCPGNANCSDSPVSLAKDTGCEGL